MSIAKTLTYEELKSVVDTYVKSNKISTSDLSTTKNNIVGLVDKIGKIFTLENSVYDKLEEFDGEGLEFGKTIEEWAMDMSLPVDWDNDDDGDKSMKDYSPSSRPVYYSYTLGRKVFPTSMKYDNIERAVNNKAQYSSVVSEIWKKQEDSIKAFKYQCKREAIGKAIAKIKAMYDNATTYTVNSTIVAVDSTYKDASGVVAVAIKDFAKSTKTFDQLVSEGVLVKLTMIHEIEVPTDELSGENFLEQVQKDIEVGEDLSSGNSISGNTLGAENHLKMYYKQGIVPSLKVKTRAGTFNLGEIDTVPSKVIKDFGGDTTGAFAILVDDRMFRMHIGYNATRENNVGFGDRLNVFRHLELTMHVSNNAFINIYVAKSE